MTIGTNNMILQGHFSMKNLENVLFCNNDENEIEKRNNSGRNNR